MVAKRRYYKLMYAYIVKYQTSILLGNERVFSNILVVGYGRSFTLTRKNQENPELVTENSLEYD